MITVSEAIVQHKGLMADNSTKLYVYLPELTAEQDAELIKLTKKRSAGVIIVETDFIDDVIELLEQVKDIKNDEETDDEAASWEKDQETGFESTIETP